MSAEDLADRVVPDLETRVEEAVRLFRQNHHHPANLLLHGLGYFFAARGTLRVLRRKIFSGGLDVASGIGLLLLGHRIEGNEPFVTVRALRTNGPRTLP